MRNPPAPTSLVPSEFATCSSALGKPLLQSGPQFPHPSGEGTRGSSRPLAQCWFSLLCQPLPPPPPGSPGREGDWKAQRGDSLGWERGRMQVRGASRQSGLKEGGWRGRGGRWAGEERAPPDPHLHSSFADAVCEKGVSLALGAFHLRAEEPLRVQSCPVPCPAPSRPHLLCPSLQRQGPAQRTPPRRASVGRWPLRPGFLRGHLVLSVTGLPQRPHWAHGSLRASGS